MLTNNKKSYFIKSIAMIMAVLMVLAVALTGCGNKAAEEAAKKADDAQTTATEAKTAAEAVAAALKDYLKVSDAVTAAAIDAMIAEAIGDCLTIEDLAGYVKSEDLKKVDDKLANYVLATALAGEITKALEGYATSAGMGDAIADAKTELEGKIAAAIQAADKTATINELNNKIANIAGDYLKGADKTALQNAINEVKTTVAGHTTTLANLQKSINDLSAALGKQTSDAAAAYATKQAVEELKAADGKMQADIKQLQETVLAILKAFGVQTEEAADKTLAEMLAEFSPEQITALIAEKMSLNNWNNATDMIMSTIANIQKLIDRVYGRDSIYIRRDMDAINAAIAKIPAIDGGNKDAGKILVFKADDSKVDQAELVKYLEYYMLRMPTVEAMTAFSDAIAEAVAVKIFDEKLADLTAELKAIGWEHTAAKKTYQTSTVADLADFYAMNQKIDALLAGYRYDYSSTAKGVNRFTGTKYDTTFGAMNVYKVVKGTKAKNPDVYLIVATTQKASEYKPATYAGYTFVDYKVASKYDGAQVVVYTINDTLAAASTAAEGSKWADKYRDEGSTTQIVPTLYKLPSVDTDFAWAGVVNGSATFEAHGKIAMAVTAKEKSAASLAETYMALYTQLTNALTAVNDAVKTFEDFLDKVYDEGIVTVTENGKLKDYTLAAAVTAKAARADGSKYADDNASLLEALTKDLCEPDEIVNNDRLFLTLEVQEKYEYAINLNTCALNTQKVRNSEHHTAELKNRLANGMDRYNLYFDMQDKCWELMFDEYQKRAIQLLDRIYNDYKSIVDGVVTFTDDNMQVIDVTPYATAEWNALRAQGMVTDGFFNAFLNGVDKFTWESNASAVTNAIKFEKTDFYTWAIANYYGWTVNAITGEREYVANNATAMTSTGATATAVAVDADPLKVLAANTSAIKLLLMANTLKVKSELAALTYDAEIFNDPAKRDVTTCFLGYFETAVDNLEEVYNRYLFEDYTKNVTNDLYTAATTYADFYTVVADKDALIEALEHYVTGYSVKKSTYAAKATDNKLFKNSDSEKALLDNGTVFYTLDAMNVPANIFDVNDPANYWTVYYTATEMIEDVNELAYTATAKTPVRVDNELQDKEVASSYLAVLENAAITYSFEAYLETASNTLQYAYLQYKANAPRLTSLLVDALDDERSYVADLITIIEYQVNYNVHANALLAYKHYYKSLLGLIASKDEKTTEHFAYLWYNITKTEADFTAAGLTSDPKVVDTIEDVVAAEIAKVLSSDTTKTYVVTTPEVDAVVRPVQILNTRDQYYAYGSGAVLLDRAANLLTQYQKSATEIKNLYDAQ